MRKELYLSVFIGLVFTHLPVLASPASDPCEALVIISSAGFQGCKFGNGFAVGDGTLIITACHVVLDQTGGGDHSMVNRMKIYSPYLGDVCHGELLAHDEALDLAVVKVPWRGHPALVLADEQEIIMANTLQTMRLVWLEEPPIPTKPALRNTITTDSDTIAVGAVAVRQRRPLFIGLVKPGKLKHGWSGSPMLLPDSKKVAGCFTALTHMGGAVPGPYPPVTPRGPAVSRLKHLLSEELYQKHVAAKDREHLPAPADVQHVLRLALEAHVLNIHTTYEKAIEPAQQFIQARPDNPFGYGMVAFALERCKRLDEAEDYYQQACKKGPMSMGLRLLYSQCLSKMGETERALAMLEDYPKAGPSQDLITIAMVNILAPQGKLGQCLALLDNALQDYPRNAYLWTQKAGCLGQPQPTLAAAEAMVRAVTLMPENGPMRVRLAHWYKQLGELDEAEKHYRRLLEVEPKDPVVFMRLAQFLVEHRPTQRGEALELAQQALALSADNPSVAPQKIQALIDKLQSDDSPGED
ncbi:tetratricopeptide repeat protein [Planctomycetota bacterium]